MHPYKMHAYEIHAHEVTRPWRYACLWGAYTLRDMHTHEMYASEVHALWNTPPSKIRACEIHIEYSI